MTRALDYFKGDELAANVWQDKYAKPGEETPNDMHRRMAKEFARVEMNYQKVEINSSDPVRWNSLSHYGRHRHRLDKQDIYNFFKDFKYIIPQGSIMDILGSTKLGSLSNCLGGNTKVLTRDGFLPIYLLKDKEVEIMTLGGGWLKAPFKSYGIQRLFKLGLRRGKNSRKEILCTIDHSWYVHRKGCPPKRTSLQELKVGDKLHSQFGKSRASYVLSSVGIAHGISYGDGHKVQGENNSNSITLCSDKRVLGIYFPNSYISSDENLCTGGSDYYGGLPNYFKEKPSIRENKSYLYGFLSGWFAADGNIDERGSLAIHSSKRSDIEFLQNVCGVLGIGCGEIQSQTIISNLTNKEHTMYKAFIHSNHLTEDFFLLDKHKERFKTSDKSMSRWQVEFITEYGRSEEVFCAEVPDTHSFVIEGNILSGNCFVIGQPHDSYGGIMLKDEEMVQLEKRRGGIGIDISTLRPSGTPTTNAAKTSTGAVSFMHRFSNTTREVAQNGRRGALMISIDINHPDVMDFIKIKRDLTQVTGANISIKLNKEFMEAVEKDEDYMLSFPCKMSNSMKMDLALMAEDDWDSFFPYNKLVKTKSSNSSENTVYYLKRIKAKEYWDEIIKSAHNVAEPGLMFWDNMVNNAPDGVYPQYVPVTTNPCSEIGMQEYDACRLIAVNLFSFVENPFTSEASFDFKKFYQVNYEAMRLSDDLIDLESEYIDKIINKIKQDPEPEYIKQRELDLWEKIKRTALSSRRTGLGFTALADTLAALGLKYDSDEALAMVESIMKEKMASELDCTIDLAILRGTFEGWSLKKEFSLGRGKEDSYDYVSSSGKNDFYQFIHDKFPEQAYKLVQYGRRNVSFSTVAPTGTVSLLAQTTSGIEPLFMPFYMRRKKINPGQEGVRVDFTDQNGDTWQEFPVLHPKFKDWIQLNSRELLALEGEVDFGVLDKNVLQLLFEKSPWYGSTANDINWLQRVKMQSVIQKYITHSISSTINLPSDVSEEEVSKIYMESWKAGLKGITVYRDGSRSGVLVSDNSVQKDEFGYNKAPKRPKELDAELYYAVSKGRKYAIIVGLYDGKPYEIFAFENPLVEENLKGKVIKKKKGNYQFTSPEYNIENLELSSELSEERMLTRWISLLLRHGANPKFVVEQTEKSQVSIVSFSKVLIRILKKYIPDGEKSTVSCNDCGSTNTRFEEGCSKCLDCGSSKCG